MTREPIQLCEVRPEDAHNFRVGMRVTWPASRPARLWRRLWRAVTRRWRPSWAVTAIDLDSGIITVDTVAFEERRWRWSWLWFRWEVLSLVEDWTFREGGVLEGIEPWEALHG